jgi:DNA-binding SARP family transcriptional activator
MIETHDASVLVRVWLLGEFQVERRGTDGAWESVPAGDWGTSSYARNVLKWLCCAPKRRALREQILENLWPETTFKLAEANLNNATSKLRRALQHPHLLQTFGPHTQSGYQLAGQAILWTDIDACEHLMLEAERLERASPEATASLERACRLFERGGCLEGDVAEWCVAVRKRLDEARRCCCIWLAEAYEQQGLTWNARGQYGKLLETNPYDEDALCRFMVLLHRQGMTQQALEYCEQMKQRLTEEGRSLSPTTRHLAEKLTHEPLPITLYLPPGVSSPVLLPPQERPSLPSVTQGILRETQEDREQEGRDMDELRRKVLQQILEVASISLLSTGQPAQIQPDLLSPITTEEFLIQAAVSIKGCWYLIKGKELIIAQEMLSACIPSLMTLTFCPSRYQQTAAGLMVQAKILQAVLAMHQLNFESREMYCHEAVKCSRLSGDKRLQAAALMYLGYTYTYCLPRKPEYAVNIFSEAIHLLNNDLSLLKSDIYMGLADAYAQCKEEQKALEAIELAKTYFPERPELDPSFLYADCGWSELYQWEGKMYLDLAQHYPDRGYYRQANDAFARSAGLQSIAERSASETIIHQADAARGLGDLELFTDCLRKGALMALSIGSQKRYSEAFDIFQRTPEKWLREQQIQELSRDIFIHTPGRGLSNA